MSGKLDVLSLYIYKGKGDLHKCKNNRGISLLSVPENVYDRILVRQCD